MPVVVLRLLSSMTFSWDDFKSKSFKGRYRKELKDTFIHIDLSDGKGINFRHHGRKNVAHWWPLPMLDDPKGL